ncbi:MAG: hypothetical protein WKF84_05915 [Pyrinomonadaceae bacterium]
MLPLNVLYRGSDETLPERIRLQAGPLTAEFEEGSLRNVRLGSLEVLRRIYVAVRDHNWGTVAASVSDVIVEQDDQAFRLNFSVEHVQADIKFFWRGAITGDASGTIRFEMEGVARSSFLRNRIGFCCVTPDQGMRR